MLLELSLEGDSFTLPLEGDLVAIGDVATLTDVVFGLDLLWGGVPVCVDEEVLFTGLFGVVAKGDDVGLPGDRLSGATGDMGDVPCEDITGLVEGVDCLCTDMSGLDGDSAASVTFAAASCCDANNLLEMVLIHLGFESGFFTCKPGLLVFNTDVLVLVVVLVVELLTTEEFAVVALVLCDVFTGLFAFTTFDPAEAIVVVIVVAEDDTDDDDDADDVTTELSW